jgi:hypothetical protein
VRRISLLLAGLASLVLVTAAVAAPGPHPAGKSKWDVYTYVGEDGPFTSQAANPKGKAIAAFDFLQTPDRAMLLTDDKSYLPKKGDLRGRTITAAVSIDAAVGTTFNYYDDGGGCGTPATVRLYFETTNPTLDESQYWWSNPVSIDLASLAALGAAGTTLSVPVTAAGWSDRDGHFGTFDATHMAAFDAAAAKVTSTGLSFGGGCNFAFGTGSDPAGATFELLKFSTH